MANFPNLQIIYAILVFVIGTCIGSFLNVVIYRLPAKISLISPPSRCPSCQHKLGMTENIPILGWLMLGGRCRWCKTKISIRYLLVELATGLIFWLIYRQYGLSITTVGYCILLSLLISLTLIDFDTLTLPGVLTKSALVSGLVYQAILGWQSGQWQGMAARLMFGIGAAVLGIWLFDLLSFLGRLLFQQEAMGGGDAKLMAAIGAWLGWQGVLLTTFLGCLSGSVIGGMAIFLGWISRRQPIPFGPFLAFGAALTVFLSEPLLSLYIKVFVPTALN
jgi:leader peptidase (prepilin peptidase) / N-methyltransferase